MLNSRLLSIIEEAGVAVLTFTEGMEEDEFLRSRLIRREVREHMLSLSGSARQTPTELRQQLPELDWDGLSMLEAQVNPAQSDSDHTLWQAAHSLVPAALIWLRVYRHNQPELFALEA